jgi:ADP-ribose pyrophosphatase
LDEKPVGNKPIKRRSETQPINMGETIVSTRTLYSGRVVTLDIHDVILPDGQFSKREHIRHPGAAAVVALDADQKVLMVRQFRLPANQVLLELPAGTLNPEEPPEECANRELQEETGYKAAYLEYLGGFFAAPGYTSEYIYLFLAMGLSISLLPTDSDEFLEVTRIPLDEAIAMVEHGEIVDGKTVNGLLRVARKLKV